MSGSGPTVFGIFDREDTAAEAIRQIQKSGMAKQSFVTVFNAGSQIEE
jgi:4-diphosphocytidyl-2-C-methyl-D-erythritol kinase